jgi:hypothetical protein
LKEVLGVGNELRPVSFIMHYGLVACQGAILTFSIVKSVVEIGITKMKERWKLSTLSNNEPGSWLMGTEL